MADVKLSQLAAVSPASVAAGAALWTFPGHVEGLKLEYVAANQLRVTSGSAYIQSLGYAVAAAAAITKTGLTLTASTWYHVYLYMNGATPDIEIVTTAPAAPYSGTARAKTGDTTRRYLGSVRCSPIANTMQNFLSVGGGSAAVEVLYRNKQDGAGFRLLADGVATAETAVDCSPAVPVTSFAAMTRLLNTATASSLYTGTSDDSAAGPPTDGIVAVSAGAQAFLTHPLSPTQQMTYWYSLAPTGTGAYIDVYGYKYER